MSGGCASGELTIHFVGKLGGSGGVVTGEPGKSMRSRQEATPETKPDLSAWVDDYSDYLLRYAVVRLGAHHRAEDLVQETFLSAHEKLSSYRGEAPPQAWLLSILKNKIADHFRRGSREAPLSATFADDADLDRYFNRCGAWRNWFFRHWRGSPEEVAESKDFLVVLQGCLDKLPPRMRQILVGRRLENLDHAAACERFGVSSSNLDVLMFRSRMHLRGCLEEHWFKPQRQGGRS
jgi:RNA polymerase sigma-70 factor (ECF subfamily)